MPRRRYDENEQRVDRKPKKPAKPAKQPKAKTLPRRRYDD